MFEPARNAERLPPPISGGTLRVLADGRTVVASDPDRDSIFVVDYRKQVLLTTIQLSPGDEPGRVEQDGQGRVHVALRRAGALVTLAPMNSGEWALVGRRAICAAPRGVAYDSAQDLLHVACADGALLSLVPAPDGPTTRRLQLDSDLRDVVVDGELLLVSRFLSAQVLTINRAGAVIERRTLPARPSFFGGRGDPTAAGTVEPMMQPGVAWRLLQVSPGQTMIVHQRALDGDVVTQPGGYSGGKCTGIVESAVSLVGPLAPAVPSPPIMGSVLPVDIALVPRGTYAVLVSAGNARHHSPGTFAAQLSVVDMMQLINPMSAGDCSIPSGRLPPSMMEPPVKPAPSQPGDVLSNVVSELRQPLGEAVAVAIDPATGHVLVQTREPATIQVVTSIADAPILLSRDSRLDTGHGIFHANSGGGLACASCHPEGGDDGRVWRFTTGLSDPSVPTRRASPVEARRTQNLRGGVMATAPFHWNGDLKDISTLMTEVFVKRMGGPTVDSAALGTLNKWLDSVPALPAATTLDGAAVERGRLLFNQPTFGCARCHVGAMLTDNKTQDVGTGRAFQVPSLRGVRYRAPYMHDGCAATLADRFKAPCGGGDKHGVTSTLTPAQVSDLVAFMETL